MNQVPMLQSHFYNIYCLYHMIQLFRGSLDILNIVAIIMHTKCVAFNIGTLNSPDF